MKTDVVSRRSFQVHEHQLSNGLKALFVENPAIPTISINASVLTGARYDPEENISRHSATDPEKCDRMAKRQGWELIGWEKTNDSILKVDCVFEGLTEFPPSP